MITNEIDLLLISKLVNVRFYVVILGTNVVPLNLFLIIYLAVLRLVTTMFTHSHVAYISCKCSSINGRPVGTIRITNSKNNFWQPAA